MKGTTGGGFASTRSMTAPTSCASGRPQAACCTPLPSASCSFPRIGENRGARCRARGGGDEPFPAEDIAIAADGESLLVLKCDYNSYSGAGWSALCRSQDNVNWSNVRPYQEGFFTAVAELADGTVLLGKRAAFDRFDGQRWQSTHSPDVSDIVVDGTRIWMSTFADVRMSLDAGRTWSQVLERKRDAFRRIAADGDRVCVVGVRDVFTSADGGKRWTCHVTDRVWRAAALAGDVAIVVGNDGAAVHMPLR